VLARILKKGTEGAKKGTADLRRRQSEVTPGARHRPASAPRFASTVSRSAVGRAIASTRSRDATWPGAPSMSGPKTVMPPTCDAASTTNAVTRARGTRRRPAHCGGTDDADIEASRRSRHRPPARCRDRRGSRSRDEASGLTGGLVRLRALRRRAA